jgi:hypothetical protein
MELEQFLERPRGAHELWRPVGIPLGGVELP